MFYKKRNEIIPIANTLSNHRFYDYQTFQCQNGFGIEVTVKANDLNYIKELFKNRFMSKPDIPSNMNADVSIVIGAKKYNKVVL